MKNLRSIRLRLLLWHAGVLAFVLCVFAALLYGAVAAGLSREMDQSLLLRVRGLSNALHAFFEGEQGQPGSAPGNWAGAPAPDLGAAVQQPNVRDWILRWSEQTRMIDDDESVAIFSDNGKRLLASEVFSEARIPDTIIEVSRGQTEPLFVTFRRTEGALRILAFPLVDKGRPIATIVSAAPLNLIEEPLDRLRRWLVWLIPGVLIATTTLGWRLIQQVLRPVNQIAKQAQRISSKRLQDRIEIERIDAEFEGLAVAFNNMLDRLERAFNRMRQFSGAASHELRTPLTVMRGELELVLRRPRTKEEYRQIIETQLQVIDEMNQMVEELLMLAKTEAGSAGLAMQPVDLSDAVSQLLSVHQGLADQKGVRLVPIASQPVWVNGERRLLERVISNLLDNALRHTPPGGKVEISVEQRDNQGCLIVQDTGPGIPADRLERIFEQFFIPRHTQSGHSTGLGLGLCHWIVETHQGLIEVASPSEGGARITVWLPSAPAPAPSLSPIL